MWRVVVCDQEPRTRGGYTPLEGCKIQNPQWVVAPVEEEEEE